MAGRLILIAHAATGATRRAAFATGAESLEQAGTVAARSGEVPAGVCLVSPARAARETAEALGLHAQPCPDLRDLEVGKWQGRSLGELAPGDVAAWLADPAYADHGGESVAVLIERMAAFLSARLAVRGTTVAITHAAPLRAALVAALGAPASTFWRIDAPPLTALRFGSDGTRWALRGLGPISALAQPG